MKSRFQKVLLIFTILIWATCFSASAADYSTYATDQDKLVASIDNMLVKYDDDMLSLSRDGGLTYPETFQVRGVGIIEFVHLFANGDVIFADHTQVYYSHDWKSYHKSAIYNEDGTPWVPKTKYDNFSSSKHEAEKQIINGIELAVWGSYSNKPGIEYSDNIKVWYTADYGKTVKCCYVFNTPETLPARHVHLIDFNPADNTFWLQTGDEAHTSHWIKGYYDLNSDNWNWVPFATGINFKTTNIIFRNGYAYWSWDTTPGGIVRAPIASMGDISSHELLFTTPNDCIYAAIGPAGDIAAFQTSWGGTEKPRVIYYAPDGVNFVRIVGDMPPEYDNVDEAAYEGFWPVNSNGKLLTGINAYTRDAPRDWDGLPSVFADDIIRKNGYPNAFKRTANTTGWVQEAGVWHYYKNGIVMVNSWQQDSDGWFYLNSQGKLGKNNLVKDSYGLCYIGSNGYWSKNPGWKIDSTTGNWIFIGNDGYLLKSSWVRDSRGWCYIDSSGFWLNHQGEAQDSLGTCIIGNDGYWTGYRK